MTQMDRVLVFDIWGDYAHFKRIETTTSPLTYPIPTGTALSGLISAIVGFERDSYSEKFTPETTELAIRIINPIRKSRVNLNLVNTKKGFFLRDIKKNPRTQIPFEFVKQPKYRIYFRTKENDFYKKLKVCLENHECFYTPYLGISELIANFEYVGEFIAKSHSETEKEEVHSIVRKDRVRLIVEKEKRYGFERIPLYMDRDRVVKEFIDIFFEVEGKTLTVENCRCYVIGSDNVTFI